MKINRKKVVEEDIKYLYAHLHSNWWDGAQISKNGGEFEEVDEDGSQISGFLRLFNSPTNTGYSNFVKNDRVFSLKINVDTGEVVNWPKKIEGWPKGIAMHIYWKIVDEGLYQYLDNSNNIIFEYEGYVPSELAIGEAGYGDYVILNIDANGMIENWDPKIAAREIAETIENESNED